jgi:hypothetical protein
MTTMKRIAIKALIVAIPVAFVVAETAPRARF